MRRITEPVIENKKLESINELKFESLLSNEEKI